MVSGIARRAAGMNRTTRSISALTRRSHVGAGAATSISSSNNNSNTRSNIAKHNSVLNSPLRFFSNTNGKKKNKDNNTDIETLIPGLGNGGGGGGATSSYGSLGDMSAMNKSAAAADAAAHQRAFAAADRSRFDVKDIDDIDTAAAALSYELTKTTAATIEKVVPWFLRTMPDSYFRQIPPYLRRDHLKALTGTLCGIHQTIFCYSV